MKDSSRLFGFVSICLLFFLPSLLHSQDLLYPEEAETHYTSLLEKGPKNSTVQEWWRKKGIKTLNKGSSFSYDNNSRLSSIVTGGGTIWQYAYRNDGKPKYIVRSYNGSADTTFYQYHPTFAALLRGASHAALATSYTYYFYDKQGRVIEEKHYINLIDENNNTDPLLTYRLVRTFASSKDNRVTGEMEYHYDENKMDQFKTIYHYHPSSKQLIETIKYAPISKSGKRAAPAKDFKTVQWVQTNELDENSKQIVRTTTSKAKDGPVIDETLFTYDEAGNVVEQKYIAYNEDQSERKTILQVYEDGLLKSYYYEDDEPGSSYQASFAGGQ